MTAALRLPCFGSAASAMDVDEARELADRRDSVAKLKAEARAQGYAEGAAAALSNAKQEERELLAAVSEALSDIAMARCEARQSALRDLRLVLIELVEALAPAARREALVEHAADMIESALANEVEGPISLAAAPKSAERLRAALSGLAETQTGIQFMADGSKTDGEVEILWKNGGASVDLAASKTAICALIDQHFAAVPERTRNAG